jgi:hypothetical protein
VQEQVLGVGPERQVGMVAVSPIRGNVGQVQDGELQGSH